MSETPAAYGAVSSDRAAAYILTLPDIARVCHEANRALCLANGDSSQVGWDDAPQWQKDSAISGVRFVLMNPTAGPEASHEEWSRHKLEQGWTYGPVKDAEAKQHPCLIPWTGLPASQRMKDVLLTAIVRSLELVVCPE